MSAPLHLTLEGCEDVDCKRHRALAGAEFRDAIRTLVMYAGMVVAGPLVMGGGAWVAAHGQRVGTETKLVMVARPPEYMRVTLVESPPTGAAEPLRPDDPVLIEWPRFEIGGESDYFSLLTWSLSVRASGAVEINGNVANFWKEFWTVADGEHAQPFCNPVALSIVGHDGWRVHNGDKYYAIPFESDVTISHAVIERDGLRVKGTWTHKGTPFDPDDYQVTHPQTWAVSIQQRVATFEGEVPEAAKHLWAKLATSQPMCPVGKTSAQAPEQSGAMIRLGTSPAWVYGDGTLRAGEQP